MKKPAEAARPPLGATKVTTGIGEATIFSMVSRIASINPPGVLRRMRISVAFSCFARSIALPTISTVMGCTMPSTSTAITFGAAKVACTSSASPIVNVPIRRNLT